MQAMASCGLALTSSLFSAEVPSTCSNFPEFFGRGLWVRYFLRCAFLSSDVDSRPPPIIHQGPQNQTLPVSSIAMLPCLASGEPVPVIRWQRNGRVLSLRDPRITILDSGTLQISGAQLCRYFRVGLKGVNKRLSVVLF